MHEIISGAIVRMVLRQLLLFNRKFSTFEYCKPFHIETNFVLAVIYIYQNQTKQLIFSFHSLVEAVSHKRRILLRLF